tara:strand:- start:877 stop:1116 length:240 start_codon:yes stop_codon:yes gene_type:complete
MRLVVISLFFIGITLFSVYYLTGYRSAFEADQACHYEMNVNYSGATGIGCDHDLETRQWILYTGKEENAIAHVVKRFRY